MRSTDLPQRFKWLRPQPNFTHLCVSDSLNFDVNSVCRPCRSQSVQEVNKKRNKQRTTDTNRPPQIQLLFEQEVQRHSDVISVMYWTLAFLVGRIEMVEWPFYLLKGLVKKFIGLELLSLVHNE